MGWAGTHRRWHHWSKGSEGTGGGDSQERGWWVLTRRLGLSQQTEPWESLGQEEIWLLRLAHPLAAVRRKLACGEASEEPGRG